ncbi:MAG: hypothetical protein QOJ65_2236 [Fimbriimonadaceae bacterium]|jgi:hypothetical protein|nr:hypothetical protein [Fimbriimonadaceae bacterium]
MTRTFRYALTAVLSLVVVIPAIAQDNFPDVPDNHWAYEALKRMKAEGILVGYPDGLFRGNRPATRYELAVAVHATYKHLKDMIDGLNSQIAAIQDQLKGTASQADLANLRSALEALQNQVNAQGTDIADLKRMAGTFEKELASLGVDVQQMKRDLGDLADRVTSLENRLPVDISGDVNFVALVGYGDSDFGGLYGVTTDGRPTGVGRGSYAGREVGGMRDTSVMHEAALTLTSARKTGPKFRLTTVVGNMLGGFSSSGTGFGTQSMTSTFAPFGEAQEDFYVQNASVAFDTSVYGLGFGVEAGRVSYKISPYIFQRADVTPYYANDRWDNGEWNLDGAILGFSFGTAKLNLIAGRTTGFSSPTTGTTVGGGIVQPMAAGRNNIATVFGGGAGRPVGLNLGEVGIDQMLGLNLNLPLLKNGSLNLAYLWLDSNTPTVANGNTNRVTVLGGDGHFSFGNFLVNAGYSQSNMMYNSTTLVDTDNKAWHASVGLESGRWGASLGYRAIDPRFAAPGDWGRIGLWWNPVDIEGLQGNFHFNLSNDIRLAATAEGYRGRGTSNSMLSHDDKLSRWTFGVEYKMATNYDLALGMEETRWNLDSSNSLVPAGSNGNAIERWYDIGFGWSLSDSAKLKFLWQISDYKALQLPGFTLFPGGNSAFPGGQPAARGGLITTQLSVKF